MGLTEDLDVRAKGTQFPTIRRFIRIAASGDFDRGLHVCKLQAHHPIHVEESRIQGLPKLPLYTSKIG